MTAIISPAEILLVDRDAQRRAVLRSILEPHWRCTEAESASGVSLADDQFVLLHAESPEETIEVAGPLLQTVDANRVAIVSSTPMDARLHQFFSAGARQFLTGAGARYERDLLWQLRAMTAPTGQELELILGPYSNSRTLVVRDRWARQDAAEQAVEFFADGEFPDAVVDLRLALDEMLNNALFHAFHEGDASEKYDAESFDSLDGEDTVSVLLAREADYNILSVSDTAGTLTAATIEKNLVRHLTMQGLMDEHGRGFFLMRSVSNGMLVRIQPGVRTEVILVFGRHTNTLVKSLQILTQG